MPSFVRVELRTPNVGLRGRLGADLRATLVVVALGLAAFAALSRSGAEPLLPWADDGFVATESDFRDYLSWPHTELHGGGNWDRVVYARVPAGAKPPYPAGTVFVKELRDPRAPGGLDIDAMVKRGGNYGLGASDAPGWEWFGLRREGQRVSITWRGTRSPGGFGGYAGSSGVTCTGCHAAARDADYVRGPFPARP